MRERTTRYVLLGILAEAGPASGYDIRQWIDQAIGHFWSESFGQIYPELKRLADEGLAERADPGAGAREQKRYRITREGLGALGAWLDRPPRPDVRRSELLLKSFFGRFAGKGMTRASLETARREAEARLVYLDSAWHQVIAEDSASPGLPFYLITIDAGRRAARARLDWVEASLKLLDLYDEGGAGALLEGMRWARTKRAD